jgi:hypothetical protein
MSDMPLLNCPRCDMIDDVQKASGMPSGQLSPPAQPQLERASNANATIAVGGLALIVLCAFLPAIVLAGLANQTGIVVAGLLVALAISALAMTVPALQARASDERAKAVWQVEHTRWEAAMEKWDELYYCWRDDVVFIPGSPSAVPAASMWDIL